MILAAGVGARMRPLTANRPKPVLPLLDQPILRLLVEQLAAQGVREVVVNAHAHPGQLRAALESAPIPVHYSVEPDLLGSGGGIRAARDLLQDSHPFLVVNGDMVLDLLLLHAAAPDVVSRIEVTQWWVSIERGPAALDSDSFRLSGGPDRWPQFRF